MSKNTGNTGQTPVYIQQAKMAGSAIPPQAWLYIIGVPIAIGAAYFLVYRPVMKKLNIIKTKEDEVAEQTWNTIRLQPFWTANYYKSYGGDTITSQEAADYAGTIYDAINGGLFGLGTDEGAIYSVFSILGSKGNISKVAEAYNIRYKKDLLNDLEGDLASDELIEVGTKISVYSS